ncbi:TPA: hypothetical protein PXN14_000117 [Yersinia enterocolitica]|uniref:Uncharacterized protein n=1 Tax=Yersinia enterocolitica W22703 TaxID=913028 RepID=F4N2G5_YEREN|nr:hypothetical protein [Yersinia enterocolitica]QCW23313.1 hypothetical protein [Yersinia phage YeP4]QCW23540.1 hypothetical protein [Yersinia phage YeP5]QCW23578.1 hypothetical protein [Yersinia phage YeP6]CBX72273.1 unknown protein [Yersinia enterocolitica W22703]ADZ41828.1 hypothetical protein YE105_C1332 [Yersinia enterocolitica subsp. palearctica 105.5R(r)]
MITLYCGKENLSALSPEWVGLIGVIAGTILTGLASYFIQRSAHKRSLEIENKRNKANFLIEYVIKDVCAFIDSELNLLQELHVQTKLVESEKLDKSHRLNLVNTQTLIQMLNDDKLLSDFKTFLSGWVSIQNIIVNNNEGDKFSILQETMLLASSIKVQLMAKL